MLTHRLEILAPTSRHFPASAMSAYITGRLKNR